MYKFVLIGLLVFLNTQTFATIFKPVKIESQLKESYSFVEGKVVEITSELDTEFGVISKIEVLPNRWGNSLGDQNGAKFIYTLGGKVGDYIQRVEGAPLFRIGEKVVVLVSKHNEKNWVHNLGLGKFSVKRVGHQEILVNQVYPTIPEVGQIELQKFLSLAKRVQNKKVITRLKNKLEQEIELQTLKNDLKSSSARTIASIQNEVEAPREHSHFWLVLSLIIILLTSRAIKKSLK